MRRDRPRARSDARDRAARDESPDRDRPGRLRPREGEAPRDHPDARSGAGRRGATSRRGAGLRLPGVHDVARPGRGEPGPGALGPAVHAAGARHSRRRARSLRAAGRHERAPSRGGRSCRARGASTRVRPARRPPGLGPGATVVEMGLHPRRAFAGRVRHRRCLLSAPEPAQRPRGRPHHARGVRERLPLARAGAETDGRHAFGVRQRPEPDGRALLPLQPDDLRLPVHAELARPGQAGLARGLYRRLSPASPHRVGPRRRSRRRDAASCRRDRRSGEPLRRADHPGRRAHRRGGRRHRPASPDR